MYDEKLFSSFYLRKEQAFHHTYIQAYKHLHSVR